MRSGRSPEVSAVVVSRDGAKATLKRAGAVENRDRKLVWKWLKELSRSVAQMSASGRAGLTMTPAAVNLEEIAQGPSLTE